MSLSNNFPTIRPTLNLDFANSGVLDPRITFTRTTTATYYDAETVAKAEENLLTYSQEFDNAIWQKSNTTVTANSTAAPDGTTTADTVSAAGTNYNIVFRSFSAVLSAGTATFSFYAKQGTKSVVRFDANASLTGTVDARANFDLASGVLGTVDTATLTASIANAGGGWYRCVVTWTRVGTAAANGIIAMSDSTSSAFASNSTAGDFYVWGAQLEQRSAVTAYTPTTTQAITNYIPQLMTAAAGQPRFDYDPITRAAKGLLIEEVRTNLLPYSTDFSSGWSIIGSSSTGTTISPDGTNTAILLTESTANSRHFITRLVSASASTIYTASFYLKYRSKQYAVVAIKGYTGSASTVAFSQVVDLQNLTLGAGTNTVGSPASTAASIQSVGNGWVRVSVTMNIGAGATSAYASASLSNSATPSYSEEVPIYTGDGYSGIYLWGAQLEAGAFPTSYIPTVAASVQRNGDAASMTGTNFSSWYTQGSGTLYEDCFWNGTSGYTYTLFVDGGNTNNIIATNTNSNTFAARVRINNTDQLDMSFASVLLRGNTVKSAIAFSTNNFAVTANGLTPQTDSAGLVPVVDRFVIGASGARTIKSIRYYPFRLTDAQLQNLTKS